jgi:hypothetical protein
VALHQHLVRVLPAKDAGGGIHYGQTTWLSGRSNPRLVGAVALLPKTGNVVNALGVSVRARIDGDSVTVEVSGPVSGPIDVLVTIDA